MFHLLAPAAPIVARVCGITASDGSCMVGSVMLTIPVRPLRGADGPGLARTWLDAGSYDSAGSVPLSTERTHERPSSLCFRYLLR